MYIVGVVNSMQIVIKFLSLAVFVIVLQGCGGSTQSDNVTPTPAPEQPPGNSPPQTQLYFPPVNGSEWETFSLSSLNWDVNAYDELIELLQENQTRAFIVLKDGKIVVEEYYGTTLNGQNVFDATRNWYWASAGKTLTSFVIGKAQENGFLDIQDASSDYLGMGWSSLTVLQEEAITIQNQLTMTSGLDETVVDSDCTLPACLLYLTSPDSRWAYHNGPYTLLTRVVENAVGESFESYFNSELKDKIGMDGFWFSPDDSYNETYYSTARSMARFGLLILNQGKWDGDVVMGDVDYFNDMINTSQDFNPAYGYLWWLNGKSSYMIPATGQVSFNGSMTPDAPADMVAAIGRDGQFINIIPSENIVVVRMGLSDENARVAVSVQNAVWEKLKLVIR